MPSCELCGSRGQLFLAMIEGSQLSVCEKCSSLGKVLKRIEIILPKEKSKKQKETPRTITSVIIAGDFAKRIRQARERSGLSQKEFAMRLNERESYVQNLENGRVKPSVDAAKKLERLLSIRLIEEVTQEAEEEDQETDSGDTLTLGDVIKIRKR